MMAGIRIVIGVLVKVDVQSQSVYVEVFTGEDVLYCFGSCSWKVTCGWLASRSALTPLPDVGHGSHMVRAARARLCPQ